MDAPVFHRRTRVILAATATAAVAALAFASPAGAASGCGAAVIKDWRDGRIDGTYSPSCFRAALSELPEDVRIYSSAVVDINRALLASLTRNATTSTTKSGTDKVVVRRFASTKANAAVRSQATAARHAAVDATATAVPIPVLVAGAAALLLVATASISVISRRLRRSPAPPV